MWPTLAILTCIAGRVRIPNAATNPVLVKRNDHMAKAVPVYHPDTEKSGPRVEIPSKSHITPTKLSKHSSAVVIDSNSTLPKSIRAQLIDLMEEFDVVFDPVFPG